MALAIKSEVLMDINQDLDIKDAYFSYLLRIWRLENDEEATSPEQDFWRVSLESTQTRNQVHFASLEDMLIFLKGQFVQIDESSDEV